MMKLRLLPRVVAVAFVPLAAALFILFVQVTTVHATAPEEMRMTAPVAAPAQDPKIAQGGVISTIQSVINYVINATVFFPARTFQEAIEKATRNIFSEQLDQFREPLEQVVAVYAFQNGAVFGSLAIPGEVNAIGARLTEAAVPVWALSLVLIGLSVLTRNAVGMGHGTVEVAAELARWLFIAFASANALAIVNLVHTGFGALTYGIASEGGTVTASQFVAAFIPSETTFDIWPILLLVIGCLLGLVIILVLSSTYIARYVMLLAITGLAPIAIACEGIPFTRFVFRDWLSMFLRLEFLQIINIAVLIVFKAMALGAAGSGVVQALLRLAIMIGLASAIIGINLSVFKQVFGVAIDVVAQMRQAAEQIVRVIGVGIGAAVTGGAAVPALAGAAASTGAPQQPETPALPKGESADSTNATHAAAASASGRAAWALSGAIGGPAGAFLRGYGDGASVASSVNAQRANAAKADEMQRAAEMRRAEGLAREMGATNSDDVEAIARSVTEPAQSRTSEQMMRAHRDNAPALREMAHQYGGPARAAAVGGYGSFGDLAIAMAHERLREGDAPAPARVSAASSQQPSVAGVQSANVDESSAIATQRSIPVSSVVMPSQASAAYTVPAPFAGQAPTQEKSSSSQRIAPVPASGASPTLPNETSTSVQSPSVIDPNVKAPAVASVPQQMSEGVHSADVVPQQAASLSAPAVQSFTTAPSTPITPSVTSSADKLRIDPVESPSRTTTLPSLPRETPATFAPQTPVQPTETPSPATPSASETTSATVAPSNDATPIHSQALQTNDIAGALTPETNLASATQHNGSQSVVGNMPTISVTTPMLTHTAETPASTVSSADESTHGMTATSGNTAPIHPQTQQTSDVASAFTPEINSAPATPNSSALMKDSTPSQPTEAPRSTISSASEAAPATSAPSTDAASIQTQVPSSSNVAAASIPEENAMSAVPQNASPPVMSDTPASVEPPMTLQSAEPPAPAMPPTSEPALTADAPSIDATPIYTQATPNVSPPLPRDTTLADWSAQVPPTPVRDWIHTPPHIGSPGEQTILPFDFGVGAMLARSTESSPTHVPLWAQTAYSLRMAYGESYVTNLMQEAQSARWCERELMTRVERHVDATPAPRVVTLFWKPSTAPTRKGE